MKFSNRGQIEWLAAPTPKLHQTRSCHVASKLRTAPNPPKEVSGSCAYIICREITLDGEMSPELAKCIGVLGKGIDIAKDILINGCSSVDESWR